jgi:colicin import membrane protein
MLIRVNALFLIASSAVFLPAFAQNALQNPSGGMPVAASTQANEHARIESERAQLEKNLDQSKQACYQKLAVTPCIKQAKAAHHAKMQELKRQEVGLNDARRKQAAAQRLAHIEARRLALAQNQGMAQPERASKANAGKSPDRAARAAKNRQQAQDRAQALQERKARAQKRQAERKKPPAAPLPV